MKLSYESLEVATSAFTRLVLGKSITLSSLDDSVEFLSDQIHLCILTPTASDSFCSHLFLNHSTTEVILHVFFAAHKGLEDSKLPIKEIDFIISQWIGY